MSMEIEKIDKSIYNLSKVMDLFLSLTDEDVRNINVLIDLFLNKTKVNNNLYLKIKIEMNGTIEKFKKYMED